MKEEERPKLFPFEKMHLLADDFPILYLDRQRQHSSRNQVDSTPIYGANEFSEGLLGSDLLKEH